MAAKRAKKATKKKATGTRKRRGVTVTPTELGAAELALEAPPKELEPLLARVRTDGGAVLATYREPLGGRHLVLVSLPIESVRPTPFQRDVSDAHVRKLTRAMDKTRRFLDPLIVVQKPEGYETPNGNHRLTALRELGAKAVIGLLVPEADVAYQILALNIEKAHSLREKALEVSRMYRELAQLPPTEEEAHELEFEEPALVTLGFGYAKRGRLAGGTYHSPLKKVDQWLKGSLATALAERERRADLVLELDDAVNEAVAKLKEKGLQSPYLKNFVVARVNPLRFIKGDPPSFDELLATMTERARKLNVDKVGAKDLASTGGASEDE
ncbi:MAG TPA: ParB N-terminal domain-containing protein [Polyangiaceae bacterium]|nr:ParB N-terminal domain-containing protein [Polyangiaceae bacterium]